MFRYQKLNMSTCQNLKSQTSKIVGNRCTFWFHCFIILPLYCFVSDYVMACGPYPEGIWNVITHSTRCAPWISWGFANALFHVMWVGALFFCQCYQVWSTNIIVYVLFFMYIDARRSLWTTPTSLPQSRAKMSNPYSHIFFCGISRKRLSSRSWLFSFNRIVDTRRFGILPDRSDFSAMKIVGVTFLFQRSVKRLCYRVQLEGNLKAV